jgi:hypothetical protein
MLMQSTSNDDPSGKHLGAETAFFSSFALRPESHFVRNPCSREAKEAGDGGTSAGDKATNHHRSNKCAIESAASLYFLWPTRQHCPQIKVMGKVRCCTRVLPINAIVLQFLEGTPVVSSHRGVDTPGNTFLLPLISLMLMIVCRK